jgi:inosine-uridine nucleoside N-ribohydrolase
MRAIRIGADIDDLCALALVLAWPGAELTAVTTVSDDGGRRAGYARHALALAGRPDLPVAAGRPTRVLTRLDGARFGEFRLETGRGPSRIVSSANHPIKIFRLTRGRAFA